MAVIKSQVDLGSDQFRSNNDQMISLVEELRLRVDQVKAGGGPEAVKKHLARNKMLARDRIETLLDPGTAFLEFSPLASWDMYNGNAPSAGIITGIGVVSGQECVIVANDATVKGGTYYPITVKKHLRAQEIATENHLPCIYLVNSVALFCPCRRRSSRPGPLWADLLQPGDNVGHEYPPNRGRHGFVYGGWRLRACYV